MPVPGTDVSRTAREGRRPQGLPSVSALALPLAHRELDLRPLLQVRAGHPALRNDVTLLDHAGEGGLDRAHAAGALSQRTLGRAERLPLELGHCAESYELGDDRLAAAHRQPAVAGAGAGARPAGETDTGSRLRGQDHEAAVGEDVRAGGAAGDPGR